MKRVAIGAVGTLLGASLPALAQDVGPWRMHEWVWGWGGMWLGPLFMLAVLALLVAFVVGLVRWFSGDRGAPPGTTPTPREILDARYARGEIDRDEYTKRRQDLSGG